MYTFHSTTNKQTCTYIKIIVILTNKIYVFHKSIKKSSVIILLMEMMRNFELSIYILLIIIINEQIYSELIP